MNVTGFDELAALVNQDKASNIPSATRYPCSLHLCERCVDRKEHCGNVETKVGHGS